MSRLADSTGDNRPTDIGIPVVVDPDVDPGVVELRNGDVVVGRICLSDSNGDTRP